MFKNFFFEYIYYRVFRAFNYKSEDDSNRGFRAATVIAVVQTFYPCDLIFFIRDIWFADYHPKQGVAGTILVCIGVALIFYNFRKYNSQIEKFDKRWGTEDKDSRFIKGLIVIVLIILPFIPLFFLNHK